MTREAKCEALATHTRHLAQSSTASSDYRYNGVTGSVEIDFVHPQHGARVVAFSDELIDDDDLGEITRLVYAWRVIEVLGEADYQPIVVTNDGPRPYRDSATV